MAAEPRTLRDGFELVGSMVRMHPAPFAISVTGAAIYAGASVATTMVLGRVTDRVVLPAFGAGPPATTTVIRWALVIIAVALVRIVGVVGRRYYAGMFSEQVARTMRLQLRDRYLTLPMARRRQMPVGELIARADNDTEVMAQVLHPLPFSLGVVFLAVFSAGALLLIDLPIAVVSFLVFPTMTLLNRIYSTRVVAPAASVQVAVGKASAIAHESFDGALIVKTLGLADHEAERFDHAIADLHDHRRRLGFLRAAFEAALGALPQLGIVAVIALGVFRVDAGAVTPGELVQIASLFTILAMPMRVFGFFLEMVPPSAVARDRILEALRLPAIDEPSDVQRIGSGPLAIEAQAVGFAWPDEPEADGANAASGDGRDGAAHPEAGTVLADIDFSVAPGEIVAIVGSTGSGKSTLCELVAGLLVPDRGVIRLDGVPLANVAVADRARAVALVFQESFLFADTVRANIDLAGTAGLDDLTQAIETAQVSEFIDELPEGLATVVGERGVTLSGGQRQRVALARALVRRPQVIVLDDATSAIDPEIEQRILDGLRTTLAATTLVVAQRLSTIRLADRVIWIDDGRVAATGTHDELLVEPGYHALVSAYELAR